MCGNTAGLCRQRRAPGRRMPIGAKRYGRRILPLHHAEALDWACADLTDSFFDDLGLLQRRGKFSSTSMSVFLPTKFLLRYDLEFAKRFSLCLAAVAWKLRALGLHRLACTGEEIALRAVVTVARDLLSLDNVEPDFSAFEEVAFEDTDFEFLFDPRHDGIEELPQIIALARPVNLSFKDWFKPFRDDNPVHPYLGPRHER